MLKVKTPWNQKLIQEIEFHTPNDLEVILESANKNSLKKGLDFNLIKRIDVLENFFKIVSSNIIDLAKLASSEGGKPIKDSIIEIERGAEGVKTAIELIKNESGSVIPMNINKASENRIAFTQKEPIGVVLAISAFNHPFNLIIHQVIPAIAAGCPVIVKPSEDTPLSCLKIIEMLYESGLPKDKCYFVMPENLDLASKLVSDSRIDFLSFIGSAKVGWMLRSKLSPGTRCALEHGGMAPSFVSQSADLEMSSKLLIRGGFYHSGQVCVSVQRIFLHKKIFNDFLKIFVEELKKFKVGDPLHNETDVGPLIRPSEVDRVESWVDEAVNNGAELISGGRKISDTVYDKTILVNPKKDDKISKKEVFGPVVCIYTYENISEAIEQANLTEVSFQASIFSNEVKEVLNFYEKINASAVFHNDHTAFRVDWMPFAGLKHSGYGVGGIKYTIEDMQIDKMLVLRK
ncbi:MAG: aldehyde dehydrogenase [Rickettsiales bacterium]|nr:aldehyde dehydrogenase [Rickettsiales bacterium]